MSSAPSTVADIAAPRVASSDQPDRFQWLVHDITGDLNRQGLNDRATAAWTSRDPVLLAAEVEAMAGVRRANALLHPSRCTCDPCRCRADIRRRKISKDSK